MRPPTVTSRSALTMSWTESLKDVNTMTRVFGSFFAKCFRMICSSLTILGEWCAPLPAIELSISLTLRITGACGLLSLYSEATNALWSFCTM